MEFSNYKTKEKKEEKNKQAHSTFLLWVLAPGKGKFKGEE